MATHDVRSRDAIAVLCSIFRRLGKSQAELAEIVQFKKDELRKKELLGCKVAAAALLTKLDSALEQFSPAPSPNQQERVVEND